MYLFRYCGLHVRNFELGKVYFVKEYEEEMYRCDVMFYLIFTSMFLVV